MVGLGSRRSAASKRFVMAILMLVSIAIAAVLIGALIDQRRRRI